MICTRKTCVTKTSLLVSLSILIEISTLWPETYPDIGISADIKSVLELSKNFFVTSALRGFLKPGIKLRSSALMVVKPKQNLTSDFHCRSTSTLAWYRMYPNFDSKLVGSWSGSKHEKLKLWAPAESSVSAAKRRKKLSLSLCDKAENFTYRSNMKSCLNNYLLL